MKKLFEAWCGISLVKRIVAGLIIGAVLGTCSFRSSPALRSSAMYLSEH